MALETKLFGFLVGSGFLLGADFGPALGIPDFKTAMAADQFHIALKFESHAVFLGQQNASLRIGGHRAGLAVDLTDYPALFINISTTLLDGEGDGIKLPGRHDHQAVSGRMRDGMKLFLSPVQPACRHRDAILRIHGPWKSPGVAD